MMDSIGYGIAFFVMVWACARWANLVSKKVPDWIHADWNHQATTFIAQKDTVMTPDATDDATQLGDPAPSYAWWSPTRAPHLKGQDHKLWWLPFVGPYLNKDYRGLWTEVWVMLLAVALWASVTTLMLTGLMPQLDMFRIVGGVFLFAWLQSMTNVDHKTQFLPDVMTLPLVWLGLLWSVIHSGLISPTHAVEGAVLGYMALWGLNKMFWIISRKQGLGGGDLKLAAALGAWVGPTGVLMSLGLASFVALGMALVLFLTRKNWRKFAFGPSLAMGGVLVYLLQPFVLYAVNVAK